MPFDTSTYSGYGQSMRDFANSVGKFSERIAQRREEEKQLKALKSAYRPFAEDLGFMSPEEFDNADAREITRRIQAQHFKAGLDELQQQRRLRDSIQAFGRDYGTGPQAPIQEGGDIGVPFALGEYAPQPNQGTANGAMGQPPATAIQRYAETPPAGNIDRLNYAIGRNPEALMSPQVGEFIGNLSRLEAVRAQQQRAQAAAMPDVPLGDYVGQTRPVDGVGTMVFNGKSWELVRPDKTQTEEEGLELGKVVVLEDGTTLVGTGRNRAPHVLPREKDRSKALTEAQSNALMYSNRLAQNNATIEEIEKGGFNPASTSGAAQSIAPNIVRSEAAQKYDAAKRNWIAAVLRKESGAAISKDEYKQADEQYFPQWGDSPAVAAQKAELRRSVERDMRRAAGQISETLPGQVAAPSAAPAGTNATATAPAQLPRYKTPQDAIKAGLKPGSVFLLYDPTTAQYYVTRMQ